jgi:tetratricopeptide (TPR) repeat protein
LHLTNLTIMLKKIFLIVLLIIAGKISHAQTADEVYEKYTDFNLAMLQNERDKALDLGQQFLSDSSKLSPKVRVSFYNGLAKLYEDDNQSVKAIEYYNRVAAAQPDYYVAHRALGYLYIKDISGKPAGQVVVDAAYIANVKKALPHLEKAQACDPDDQTLSLIKILYRNIKDEKSLNSLPERLNQLKKNCIDILDTNK